MLKLVGTFFLLALLARTSLAVSTVYISPNGNDRTGTGSLDEPYLSLQKAIESSQTPGNPDVNILCQPGVYFYLNNSNIVVTQGTIDISPSPSGVCEFLLYHSSGEVFFINAVGGASLVLTNLEITGGTSLSNGGLISVTGGGTITANFVTFANGTTANYGGLIYLAASAGSTFSNCQFYHGVTTAVASAGGAVSAVNTDVTFLGCNFTGNSAERGGAVQFSNQQDAINYAQSPTFTACSFISNQASPAAPNNAASSVSGGAVQIDSLPDGQSVQFNSCSFDSNKAETASGGAIYIGTSASAKTFTCSFKNHKSHIGGAIYAETAEYRSTNSDYYSNTATHINDDTSGQGGAIAVHTGFLFLSGCVFELNTAGTLGGAVSHYGGAGHLSLPNPADSTNISGCTFIQNVAINGGGFYAYGLYNLMPIINTNWIQNRATGSGLQSGGGAIFSSSAPVQIQGNSFENNTAEVGMGGAMYVARPVGSVFNQDFSPSVATSYFQFNRAATGGAVCLDGLGNNSDAMSFQSSRFAQNTAVCTSCTTPTGVEGFGGGLMVYNTSALVFATVFYDNFASLKGGAFYAAGDVAANAFVSSCSFYGNQVTNDVNYGGLTAFVGGLTTAHFKNANETLDPSDGYQFVITDNADFTLVAGEGTSPCVFSGLAARGNAQVNINCSMAIDHLDLEDAASINLKTTSSMTINKNIIWRGGGFQCTNLGLEAGASNSIIYFRASTKGTASLSNSQPKYLNSCNFASTGTVLIQNFPGAQLTDLEVYGHTTPEIFNYGKMLFTGDVILNNEGQTVANLQSEGEMRIESTLSLNGRSAFNFVGLSTRNEAAPYFTIFLQNRNSSFGTTAANEEEGAVQTSSTSIPTYTAFTVNGEFHPQGNFQVILPDFWKGTWTDLIKFTSRTAKFLTKRMLVPNADEKYDTYKMKVKYNSNSIDCSIKKSQSSMNGGQVFGVIFGVLLAVLLIAGLAYYFYRRHHGPPTFEGEVYEPINQPKYGTTD